MDKNNLDKEVLYKYGLYVNSIAGTIKGIDKKKITEAYNQLAIHSKNDIKITSEEIMKILDRGPGKYLKDIYNNLEKEILYGNLQNDYEEIKNYIQNNYSRLECF